MAEFATSEVIQDSNITRENYGDIFMLAYADYLRRYDQHCQTMHEGEAELEVLRHIRETLFSKIDPSENQREQLESIAAVAGKIATLAQVIEIAKLNKGRASFGKVYDDENNQQFELPFGRVRITDLNDSGRILRLNQQGEVTDKTAGCVEGSLMLVDLMPWYGTDGGVVKLLNKTRLRPRREYHIFGMINRENYTANVKIEYL